MSYTDLVATATGCSSLVAISTEDSYSQLSGSAQVECASSTLSVGDSITITIMGTTVHTGYVKKVEKLRPEGLYRISSQDILVRAIDYFIAADDPEDPFKRCNISSLNLVRDLLGLCGITNVTSIEPSPVFTWGTSEECAKFNLQSVADAIQFISGITGNSIWYDRASDEVKFQARKPYVAAGDTSSGTWTTGASGNIIEISYLASNDKVRNRVVVYGKTPIKATASAASPYVVVDQSMVMAHELIDTQSMADQAAAINLEILNRLEQRAEVILIGDAAIAARSVYHISESFTSLNNDVFAYRVSHMLNEGSGFTTSVSSVL